MIPRWARSREYGTVRVRIPEPKAAWRKLRSRNAVVLSEMADLK